MPTILIADDNSNIQKMAADILSKDCGYKVERVGNGEHAVRKLPDLQPDLILADIFMPVRNGYEVCEYVKGNEQFQHIPVVLLQGKFDPLDEHLMKKVRADGLLMKPFVPKEPLITMVKSLLEESAAVRAAAAAAKAKGAKPSATVEMTRAEVDKLTGKTVEAPPPEPEVADYAVQAPRVEIKEGDHTLAFGDLLGAPAETVSEAPKSPEPEGFQASSVAGVEFVAEPGVKDVEEEEEPAEPPMVGGIEEELKQPSPDEPPIKVEFGPSEPMELVTDEPTAAPSAVAAGPLPELATTPDEWIFSGPPKVEVPPEAQQSWQAAPPAHAAPPVAEIPPPAVAPPPEPAPAPAPEPTPQPQAYEPPKLEEIPAPPPQMDAVPAVAVAPEPAPRVEAFAAPPAVDPALVDAVVEKVLARLQPQIMEQVTREIVRPLAEALIRREFQK